MSRLNKNRHLRSDASDSHDPDKTRSQEKQSSARKNTEISNKDFSIVAVDKFIHATRDSGYKGTSSAVSELVDNAIQADASCINITVAHSPSSDQDSIDVLVQDNGTGMDPITLRHALRFGGSTRFNDRNGLGRYGMGLPNSSLSQARRVTVYTWQSSREVFMSYLDVDEIADAKMTEVPPARRADQPPEGAAGKSGTIVAWSRCDRLDFRRISTISRKLLIDLGRRFRHLITNGVKISVNGTPVEPIDPLFLNPHSKFRGAALFGEPVEYEVQAESDNGEKTIGHVRVTFSELPVHEWHKLSNDEKRRFGISKGSGVSVVRAGREVDYGWFFMGEKARENYDDWWRCEIQFDPVLDEAFGITHTKQQIRPKGYLLETLSPDIEATARALNSRVRKAHLAAKAAERVFESEQLAEEREKLLEPLPTDSRIRDQAILKDIKKHYTAPRKPSSTSGNGFIRVTYKIVETAIHDTSFFNYARQDGGLVLVLNPNHPFYKRIYRQLADSDAPRDRQLLTQLELLLFAAARSEATEDNPLVIAQLERQRQLWSDILATFLNG